MFGRESWEGLEWCWLTGWRCRGLRRIGRGRFTNRPYVCVVIAGGEDQDVTSALTRSPYVGIVVVPTRMAMLWFNPHRSWGFTNRPYVRVVIRGRRGPGCDISAHAIALCGVVVVPTRTAMPWFNPHRSWAVHEPPLRVCGYRGRRGPGWDISANAIALCVVSHGTNEDGDAVV